jgi:hypothetical protein
MMAGGSNWGQIRQWAHNLIDYKIVDGFKLRTGFRHEIGIWSRLSLKHDVSMEKRNILRPLGNDGQN